MAVFTYTADYYGHSFKVGSTWTFHFNRKAGTPAVPVDITGLISRIMFRADGLESPVALTLTNDAITNGGATGIILFTLSATQTATLVPNKWHYFDIEMTAPGGHVWQSPTMRFKTEQESTR